MNFMMVSSNLLLFLLSVLPSMFFSVGAVKLLNRYPRTSFFTNTANFGQSKVICNSFKTPIEDNPPETANPENGDELLTGLNGFQDLSCKVLNCRELIQEFIIKNDLSPLAAKAAAEQSISTLMMGSNMKGQETLQVSFVGTTGVGSITTITNGQLQIRCRVGNPRYIPSGLGMGETIAMESDTTLSTFLGEEGQLQVTRMHPAWKQPQTGIVKMRTDLSIPLNMALYVAESDQRQAVMLTDVVIDGGLCRTALGLMVEALPGATEQNIEKAVANVQKIKEEGLRSYLDKFPPEYKENMVSSTDAQTGNFPDFLRPLTAIMDDALRGCEIDENNNIGDLDQGISWSKFPTFKCSCGIDRVWRTLALLGQKDIDEIIEDGKPVEMKCDFCGSQYNVPIEEVVAEFRK